jgi:hypothetical protein
MFVLLGEFLFDMNGTVTYPLRARAAVFFHTEYYEKVIQKFLDSSAARNIPRKEIVLETRARLKPEE